MGKILVETSARHIHLTKEAFDILVGKDVVLEEHIKKNLSQPGQYATDLKFRIVGSKGELNASLLGPLRDHNQVELSLTDARSIGVNAPVRESGDVKGSGACKIIGPAGEIDLVEGVIAAKRHIHMTEEDAKTFNVQNGDIVSVKVESNNGRNIIFADTVVRVSKSYALAMHIDTDESNAGCCFSKEGVFGELIK